jgi:hypothetical protein
MDTVNKPGEPQDDWTRQCKHWLPVKLVRAMFDLGPDLKTRNHPGEYIGDWRRTTYEEVHRATRLSKNKVKQMYRKMAYNCEIDLRVHKPQGNETCSEVITYKSGHSDMPIHITAPWLKFNYEKFSKRMQFALACEKYGHAVAARMEEEREQAEWDAFLTAEEARLETLGFTSS